ncbi:hypothetical protein L211DRAFT_836618 [Terfezia boudieri ATCC MYA-4762]|uniref:TOM core complex subunit Tom6 n=1 Tax=Terfezia boudieri ATCC MYA-4762 TaxID=1051890 RepID=A0A3N4LR28_9PEZI|nr:hypothetical protein L211DRAFT_836618 [Terfezia boudieri ATCC MYA-4762]
MPAKRGPIRHVSVPAAQQRGYISSAYQALKSPENASIVKSIAMFGAAVAFLHSSWAEILVPQF